MITHKCVHILFKVHILNLQKASKQWFEMLQKNYGILAVLYCLFVANAVFYECGCSEKLACDRPRFFSLSKCRPFFILMITQCLIADLQLAYFKSVVSSRFWQYHYLNVQNVTSDSFHTFLSPRSNGRLKSFIYWLFFWKKATFYSNIDYGNDRKLIKIIFLQLLTKNKHSSLK